MYKPDILQMGEYPQHEVDALEEKFTLHHYYDAQDKEAFVAERVDVIRGIATRGDIGVDGSVIRALVNLEVIAVYGVGFDAVDLNAACENNVAVSNTPDVLTEDVADLALAMMLAASRGIIGAEHWVRSKQWQSRGAYGLQNRVFSKSVGVLGLGRIGCEVAKRCEAFSMPVSYCDVQANDSFPNRSFYQDAVSLAENSDFLFVTATGGDSTRHIVNKEVIEALGQSGMLINVSRASNIDELALLDALEAHTVGFAALDVFEGEPELNPRFLALDNVLLQPHHASGTFETRADMASLVLQNLNAHFSGNKLITPVIERE